MTVAEAIYLLSAVTSLLACVLLFRHYLGRRTPLLLWSCVGFFGLAVNNSLVYADLVLLVGVDLNGIRTLVGAVAMATMLFGFIWEGRR
jgi:hypothetical protein